MTPICKYRTACRTPTTDSLHYMQRPTTRAGRTKVISNDRGHLLPEAERSTKSPWGEFVGTWQQEPKQVQLKVRTKMINPRVTVDTSWKRCSPPFTQADLEGKANPAKNEEVTSHPASKASERTASRQSVGSPRPDAHTGSRPTSNVSERTTSRQSVGRLEPEVHAGSRPTSNVSQRTTSHQSVTSPKPEMYVGSRPVSNTSQRTASRQSVTAPSPAPGDSGDLQMGSVHGTPLPRSPAVLEN